MDFSISRITIDVQVLSDWVADPGAGAVVAFEGRVRNHAGGRSVGGLDYEAYEALAVKEGNRIIAEARQRFPVLAAVCVHRVGSLDIGDCAVWIGVSSAHRAAAFEACRYIIDEVKARVPIWKRERYRDGPAEWVECSTCAGHGHHAAAGNTSG